MDDPSLNFVKSKFLFLLGLLLAAFFELTAQPATAQMQIKARGAELELNWPGSVRLPSGATVYPLFQLEQSADFQQWKMTGPKLKGTGGSSPMKISLGADQPRLFYRLSAQWDNTSGGATGTGGDEVFGYGAAFAEELRRLGQISPQEFAARYGVTNAYLTGIDWDPTTAIYWDLFATDPAAHNVGLSPTNQGYRYYDFRLNSNELAVLRRNGFVVSERLGTTNFAESFYRLWNDDLPVFVSADALLQAWHRSYDNLLMEMEHLWLSKTLEEILDGMAGQIQTAQQEASGGPLEASVLDADYFLTVARTLLKGTTVASALAQGERVQQTLTAISNQTFHCFTVFDYPRWVDFSQFKPRGHYEQSERLRRYFRATMWLGRIDLRTAGVDRDCDGNLLPSSPRQLGTAIVLARLLDLAGQVEIWQQLDRVVQTFVGWTDSLTFPQLADVTASAGIHTLADVTTPAMLRSLQAQIEQGALGVQNIRGDAFVSPIGPEGIRLPRSFTVFGQKFALDSWALSKVVWDEILWAENGVTNKIERRVPSCLDVAFSVLANDQIVPELVARMTNTAARDSTNHMVRWRDGLPYQHNLAAVRNVIDSQDAAAWEDNIYLNWLATLRELSPPTTDPDYPQPMRTRAWALKTLNTQLGSWSQLRHDTLLYVKQSYTGTGSCSYPDGYVEPRVGFWRRLEQMATRTASLIQSLPQDGVVSDPVYGSWELERVQTNQINFLTNFAAKVAQLREMAEQELRHQPLTPPQLDFIDGLMQTGGTNYARVRDYSGWYPQLFYRNIFGWTSFWGPYFFPLEYGATKFDATVADVHTDPRDEYTGDPGSVLHQGVGKVHLLFVAVDSGTNRTLYAGPVLSQYEFEMPVRYESGVAYPERKTDTEWKDDMVNGRAPPHAEWTKTFLVPSQ